MAFYGWSIETPRSCPVSLELSLISSTRRSCVVSFAFRNAFDKLALPLPDFVLSTSGSRCASFALRLNPELFENGQAARAALATWALQPWLLNGAD